MPFDTAGVFSLVPSYRAIPGNTVRTENHNPPLEDIANGLSSVLPRDGRAGMVGPLPMGGFAITNLAPGSASTDAATVGQVQSAMPVGSVIDFAGAAAPAGWLLCYGQAVSRTAYAALFSVIGTVFGAGDGSTTFNVPDARGRVSAGRDNMGGTSANRLTNLSGGLDGDVLGATGGAEVHQLTADQNGPHTHAAGTLTAASAGAHTHDVLVRDHTNNGKIAIMGSDDSGDPTSSAPAKAASAGAHTHSLTGASASSGTGAAHNNVQPTIIFSKIIKAIV